LPADRAYQLWSLDGTTPVSLGVLGDGSVAALAVPLPHEAARLAITAEPAGGGAMPTGSVVARGLLPAPA
jgi:anti-sigma-K factor RskA